MATTAEQVRALTGLTVDELADDSIVALLELHGDVVSLAAADALETFASTLTSVESDDIKIDGSKRAGVLMARAGKIREQYYLRDGGDFFFDTVCGPDYVRPYGWVDGAIL